MVDLLWNDAIVARMRALHLSPENFSARVIANILSGEFNVCISRNAVIGKTKRLNMPPRPALVSVKGPRATRRRTRQEKPPTPIPVACRLPVFNVDLVPVSLVDVLDGACRFPVSDSPFLCCGQDSVDGLPYCPLHCAIAFTPKKEAALAGRR